MCGITFGELNGTDYRYTALQLTSIPSVSSADSRFMSQAEPKPAALSYYGLQIHRIYSRHGGNPHTPTGLCAPRLSTPARSAPFSICPSIMEIIGNEMALSSACRWNLFASRSKWISNYCCLDPETAIGSIYDRVHRIVINFKTNGCAQFPCNSLN